MIVQNKLNRSEVPLMSIYLIFFPRLIWSKAGAVVRHMSQLGGYSVCVCVSCSHCLSFCMLAAYFIKWFGLLWAIFGTYLLDLGDDINIIESLHADILWWVPHMHYQLRDLNECIGVSLGSCMSIQLPHDCKDEGLIFADLFDEPASNWDM